MHFLISGIPASGKSTFCRWLEEKKSFLHLDVEKPGVLDRHGLATAWATLFDASTSAAPFIETLEKFKRPVVIDWGFPPECLNTVRKLSEGGVILWWFAADWAVARRKFKERGTISMGHFDIQIRKIEAALPDINALFRSHKQYTLPSTGIYPPPDKIWESMLDTLADSAKKPDSRTPQAPVPNPEQTSSKY
jgi:hypothetical protein